jgi:ABC-type cobalamin/Fe3+-siderophores transport system ATPase subunit
MIFLKSFTYRTMEWTLNKVYFNRQSLVVGQNATGKTKLLESISTVINTVLMKDFNWKGKNHFSASLEFDGDMTLLYNIEFREGKIVSEELLDQNRKKLLVSRTSQTCFFYDEDGITLPERSTALIAKQDIVKYKEAASIMQWAQTTRSITFSLLHIDKNDQMRLGGISMEEMYEGLNPEEHQLICQYMNKLDYHLVSIQEKNADEMKYIVVKEDGLNDLLTFNLSNGMYRVLYILFYMLYISKQHVKCILVDDLGEGLDYDRATKLGKIVFDFCKEHSIQLVATSNDSFLMNVVPLNNWVILTRALNTVDAISIKSHKGLFDKFTKTGLRNFDILRTDFIERNK